MNTLIAFAQIVLLVSIASKSGKIFAFLSLIPRFFLNRWKDVNNEIMKPKKIDDLKSIVCQYFIDCPKI